MSAAGGAGARSQDGAHEKRAERLAARLRELELDALLVESLVDVRYLTGFTGSNAMVLALAEPGSTLGPHRFYSDFRYGEQSAEEVADGYEREIVTGDLLDALARTLGGGNGRLGFVESTVTVKERRLLGELTADDWELVACEDEVARLRTVKDDGEIASIRAAAQLADTALTEVLEGGLAGRTEQQIAFELEVRMRRLGAQAGSFPAIVAAGAHGALPHAQPRAVEIPRDVLVTIDWGALHDGYCSDCTRTYATGEGVSERAREVYAIVLEAELAGLATVRPGISGREADAAARSVIERAGEGDHFGHGLGHGVGMDVHEGPRLSRTASEAPLQAGSVVTVEPGIYIPGELGVRIEDLVVLGEGSQEVVTGLPKTLTVIS